MLLFLTLAVLRGDSPFPRKRGRSCFQVLFVFDYPSINYYFMAFVEK